MRQRSSVLPATSSARFCRRLAPISPTGAFSQIIRGRLGEVRGTVTRPRLPVAAIVGIVFMLGACHGPTQPSTPSASTINVPGTRPSEPLVRTGVSGTVFEVTNDGIHPLGGAQIMAPTIWGLRSANSDPAGHYEITGLHDLGGRGDGEPLQSLFAFKDGYSQPCRPTITEWLAGRADDVNIHLAPDDILATSGMPPLFPTDGPIVEGRAITADGRRTALAGVRIEVNFLGFFRPPSAWTVSDASGRFALCGLAQPYRPFSDEGGTDFPRGIADVSARRRAHDAPITSLRNLDVRTLTQLEVEVR